MKREKEKHKPFKPKEKFWNPDDYEINMALVLFFDKVTIRDQDGRLILRSGE